MVGVTWVEGPTPRLVGRAEELAEARSALARGGCVIAGPAGVGKSRLASEMAASHPNLISVLATASASTIPFGAVGHLLPAEWGDESAIIPAVIERLRSTREELPVPMLIDDAHLLDEASAALVLALVTAGVARPMVTLRTGEPSPDAVTALWKEYGLRRIELQDLSPSDVGELVGDLLDGTVHPDALDRISDLSRGNPLYAVELVHDARQTGALTPSAAGWRWREDTLGFDRLAVIIGRRVSMLPPDASRALELLAIAGSLPQRVLDGLVGPPAVVELERRGIATLRHGPTGIEAVPSHPLIGEVVATGMLESTAIARRRELAQAYRDHGPGGDGASLLVAVWRLDAGEEAPADFLEAAGIAIRRGSPDLAERLAACAGPTLDAALVRAEALNSLARFEEADNSLGPFVDAGSEVGEAEAMILLENWFRARLCGPRTDDAVVAVLDRAESWHESPDWRALVAMSRSWILQFANRPSAALEVLGPSLADSAVSSYPRFHLLSAAVHAQLRLGRVEDSMANIAEIERVAEDLAGGPWLTRYARLTFPAMARIDAGHELANLEDTLRQDASRAIEEGDVALGAVATMMLGLAALRRGHASNAVEHLGRAVASFGRVDPGQDWLIALRALAQAHVLAGDAPGASEALAGADAIVRAQPRVAGRYVGQLDRARHAAAMLDGSGAASLEALIAVADGPREEPAVEVEALYDAFRLGGSPALIAGLLRPRVAAMQNELATRFLAHVEADARGDGHALLDAAWWFAERSLDLFAAEAAAGAGRAFLRQGRPELANAATLLSDDHQARCGRVWSPALAMPVEVQRLTARELEVARMVAAGMSNKAIADSLVISVRTVEGFVLRACQKLGIHGRHELAARIAPPT